MSKQQIQAIADALRGEYSERILREDARRHDAVRARDQFLALTEEQREEVLAALKEDGQ